MFASFVHNIGYIHTPYTPRATSGRLPWSTKATGKLFDVNLAIIMLLLLLLLLLGVFSASGDNAMGT